MKRSVPLFSVTVRVPASSANLGSGFDALGLALDVHDEWTVTGRRGPAGAPTFDIEGGPGIPRDRTNLAYRAFQRVFQLRGRALPSLHFLLQRRLPVAGGLGSSSAAVVGGLLAANAVLGSPLDDDRLLDLAAAFEGHPDNVAPALLGGFCAATLSGGRVRCLSWRDPALFRGLLAVAAVPNFALKTERARAVLPARVPRADAVFNTGRAALLVGALLTRRFDFLGEAMEDRLHEPYRKKLVPGFDAVVRAAEKAGAYGASLSGAGPTLLALSPAAGAVRVGAAMARAFARAGVTAETRIFKIDPRGARVSSLKRG